MATTAIQKTESFLPAPILTSIQAIMPQIPALLPPDISLEQFRAAVWLELQQVRGIEDCSGASVAASLVKAANAGLLPGRDCHILPFKNQRSGRKEATMVPNYQGLILSLERTGKVKKAFAHAVYSRDTFEVDYLADVFSHKPSLMGDRGKMQCVYGCILEKDGTRHFEVMSLGQVDAIKARAPGHDNGPWTTDYEEMARKTALKRVMKFVRLSPAQQQLIEDEDTRERSDIPTERFQQLSDDLYGEAREIPNFARQGTDKAFTPPPLTRERTDTHDATPGLPGTADACPVLRHGDDIPEPDDSPAQRTGGESFIDQITAVMRAHGEADSAIADYWHRTARRCQVSSAVAIKAAWLPKLLDERREYYAKQDAQHTTPVVADVHLDGTTVTEAEPTDWRGALTALQAHIQEAEILGEIWDALNSDETPDDIGQAVLARATAHQVRVHDALVANTDA